LLSQQTFARPNALRKMSDDMIPLRLYMRHICHMRHVRMRHMACEDEAYEAYEPCELYAAYEPCEPCEPCQSCHHSTSVSSQHAIEVRWSDSREMTSRWVWVWTYRVDD